MQELHAALLALQELDGEIARAEEALAVFDPRITELDAPVLAIEREIEATRHKLDEQRAAAERLAANAQQKRSRLDGYEERLSRTRTSREESTLRVEIDLVRRALDADASDIRQTSEQITRLDLKIDDLERQAAKVRQDIAPQRNELLQARQAAEDELVALRDRRENQAVRLDPQSRRLYERLRGGRTRTVLAPLTEGGACGNCFNVLPVQEQALVRRGDVLHRCESCGVILYVP
jgi:predicted  nucleic acid-binding Zn-ribbon protein